MSLHGDNFGRCDGANGEIYRAASLVALIAALLIPIPCAFYKWGKIIRLKSPILQKLQKEKAERGDPE